MAGTALRGGRSLTMKIRRWALWGVLLSLLWLPGAGIAQMDDAPSLAGVIDIHAHVAPETALIQFQKRAYEPQSKRPRSRTFTACGESC